jgi:hypothetical protein
MNPFGLRAAQVSGARSGLSRRVKTPPISYPDASSDQTQLMIAGTFRLCEIYAARAGQRHVGAMQQYEFLFIFQKDIRAGIEYRV